MARDLVLLAGIATFWFILVVGFGLITADESFQQLAITGNTTFSIDELNTTFEADSGDTTLSVIAMQKTSFWGMIVRLFTFRIPAVTGIPPIIATFISFFNYILVILIVLLAFRQLRSGSG